MKQGDDADALKKVEISLQFNGGNNLAMGLKATALATTRGELAAQEYIDQSLKTHPLSYALHYARWAIGGAASARDALISVTGQRGINASTLAGWLVSLGKKQDARELLVLLDSRGDVADAVASLT